MVRVGSSPWGSMAGSAGAVRPPRRSPVKRADTVGVVREVPTAATNNERERVDMLPTRCAGVALDLEEVVPVRRVGGDLGGGRRHCCNTSAIKGIDDPE